MTVFAFSSLRLSAAVEAEGEGAAAASFCVGTLFSGPGKVDSTPALLGATVEFEDFSNVFLMLGMLVLGFGRGIATVERRIEPP